jgi:hypothetical protein
MSLESLDKAKKEYVDESCWQPQTTANMYYTIIITDTNTWASAAVLPLFLRF